MTNQNIPQLSSVSDIAPSAPSQGDLWFDDSTNKFYVFSNDYWEGLSIDHRIILDIKYGSIKYILYYIDNGGLFLNVTDSEGEGVIKDTKKIFEKLSNILNKDALLKIEKEIYEKI